MSLRKGVASVLVVLFALGAAARERVEVPATGPSSPRIMACSLFHDGYLWTVPQLPATPNYGETPDIRATMTLRDGSHTTVFVPGDMNRTTLAVGAPDPWPVSMTCDTGEGVEGAAIVPCTRPSGLAMDAGTYADFESLTVGPTTARVAIVASVLNFMHFGRATFSNDRYWFSIDHLKPDEVVLSGLAPRRLDHVFANLVRGNHEIEYGIGDPANHEFWNVCFKI